MGTRAEAVKVTGRCEVAGSLRETQLVPGTGGHRARGEAGSPGSDAGGPGSHFRGVWSVLQTEGATREAESRWAF